MSAKPEMSVLFVCLGNICRSPLAEGVFRAVCAEQEVEGAFLLDSAGTGGWHAGSSPDPRSIAIAAHHGVDISGQRARKVVAEDFDRFDLILGMDRSNVEDLRRIAPAEARQKIHLFLEYATGRRADVPDPYYGGPEGFAEVYRMIRSASEALADRLLEREPAPESGQASSIT
ncbi:low molecular weight protein-tyrosine-phosphatase [Pseudaminobacter soli (ex Li et al. 2025)]|uniref:protein-tyrosine-phosphatase n=1 Tax=Pseudaminobacter soli (ex Li et al. 2025) TaxID=1295366 RepID=A0A2P7SHX4_9HYPH|nr:low molecular weight protein-tyrosine-phosphatase [Mesorhizobium soli]PSJ62083.1 low molecular weight phosphotyrosine protein phosphatase [Mesorhizobium soli]